jgi:hypothetical protein
MKVVSCNCCGVVLDLDKLPVPQVGLDVDYETCRWDNAKGEFIPYSKCPVCKSNIEHD